MVVWVLSGIVAVQAIWQACTQSIMFFTPMITKSAGSLAMKSAKYPHNGINSSHLPDHFYLYRICTGVMD